MTFVDNGRAEQTDSVIQDEDHAHKMEVDLLQAQKMEAIGTLVGGIAHDFNNKLSAITGNLYLAREAVGNNPEAIQRLRAVEQLSFEASSIVRQLLAFARKGKVKQAPLNLATFIKEAAKINRVAIPANIHLSLDYDDDPLTIRGDITQLQQAFLNLLNNARDALEETKAPRIDISLQHMVPDEEFRLRHQEAAGVDAYACLQMADNGHGIEPAYLHRIFDPFFTTKESEKGTGLGLAMVTRVVQAHHGIIEVESRPGEGTCFSIFLPLCQEAVVTKSPVLQQEAPSGHGELLLIADDDSHVREVSRDVLQSLGYRILAVKDGREAVEAYRQHRQDIALVILDLVMPHLNGTEVAKQIRQMHPEAKVLYATGYDMHHAREKTPDDASIIQKPYRVHEAGRIIHDTLRSD